MWNRCKFIQYKIHHTNNKKNPACIKCNWDNWHENTKTMYFFFQRPFSRLTDRGLFAIPNQFLQLTLHKERGYTYIYIYLPQIPWSRFVHKNRFWRRCLRIVLESQCSCIEANEISYVKLERINHLTMMYILIIRSIAIAYYENYTCEWDCRLNFYLGVCV